MSYTQATQLERKVIHAYLAQDTLALAKQLDSIPEIEMSWCKGDKRSPDEKLLDDSSENTLKDLQTKGANITFYGQGNNLRFYFSKRKCRAVAEHGFSKLYRDDAQAADVLFEHYTRYLSLKKVIGAGVAAGASLTAIIVAMVAISGQ